MINITLQGGMCNQFFQYALGRDLEKRGFEITYDRSRVFNLSEGTPHNRFKPQFGLDGFHFPAIKFGPSVGEIHNNEDMHYDEIALNPHDNMTLRGHWQSEKYFLNVINDLRLEMFPKLSANPLIGILINQIDHAGKDSVAVQVRRTDYAWPSIISYHGVMNKEYFDEGIHLTGGKKIFVITDDPEWCQQNVPGTLIETHNRYWDLFLMSMCQHAVIANSSFGWWGAWIGDAKLNRIVVAPKNWFVTPHIHSEDIVPDRWIKL